jgi:hypothetical protein
MCEIFLRSFVCNYWNVTECPTLLKGACPKNVGLSYSKKYCFGLNFACRVQMLCYSRGVQAWLALVYLLEDLPSFLGVEVLPFLVVRHTTLTSNNVEWGARCPEQCDQIASFGSFHRCWLHSAVGTYRAWKRGVGTRRIYTFVLDILTATKETFLPNDLFDYPERH